MKNKCVDCQFWKHIGSHLGECRKLDKNYFMNHEACKHFWSNKDVWKPQNNLIP